MVSATESLYWTAIDNEMIKEFVERFNTKDRLYNVMFDDRCDTWSVESPSDNVSGVHCAMQHVQDIDIMNNNYS